MHHPPPITGHDFLTMRKKTFTFGRAHVRLGRVWISLLCFGFSPLLFAHDPGLSVVTARLGQTGLNVHLAMSPTDVEYLVPVDANHDGKISPEELNTALSQLEKMALGAFEVKQDGQSLAATKAKVQTDKTGAILFDVAYPGPTAGELKIRSGIISSLARGHRQFLSIRDRENKLLSEEMLNATQDSCVITVTGEVSPPAVQHSFREFLLLGIMHIATGYDHILFLLGLLIIGGSFKSAIKIITAFTVAHSITLALATMNLINITPRIIEPLIAVSIIYVGVENMVRRDMDKRWLLAFGFGLVHGCGFASALRDLGIGSDGTGIVVPLFSFNLGVEMCQMTIAALVLPVIWKLRERPQFVQRFVPVGSCLIALAGTWWLLQRTLL
jgi:hydrogenase/urease accessory protein HupE